jgi:hypothetical protein
MHLRRLAIAPIAACVLTLVLLASGGQAQPQPFTFTDTFDGSPSGPTPWHPATWAADANMSDGWGSGGMSLDAQAAHHGSDCAGHPATHTTSTTQAAIFQ